MRRLHSHHLLGLARLAVAREARPALALVRACVGAEDAIGVGVAVLQDVAPGVCRGEAEGVVVVSCI